MAITLYELAGADADRRFSPYCWRVRMALLHKGLSFETEPVRFSEKVKIAFSGQGLVPVLVDGGRTITDSFTIAMYLEDTREDAPSLFGGAGGLARFGTNAADRLLMFSLASFIATDVLAVIAEQIEPIFGNHGRSDCVCPSKPSLPTGISGCRHSGNRLNLSAVP